MLRDRNNNWKNIYINQYYKENSPKLECMPTLCRSATLSKETTNSKWRVTTTIRPLLQLPTRGTSTFGGLRVWEECFCWLHRDTFYFTFVLGCSRVSGSVSRAFFLVLFFSLSGLFNSRFFYAGASKTQSFWVFPGFYYKNKRICKGKMEDKDLKHSNQQVKHQDIK